MAQVDGSGLPPVQEVCRDFAVLEDGALAHRLQEQEVEQHYASNVQKNQLVQRDLRVARRLQDLEWEETTEQTERRREEEEEGENDQEMAHRLQDVGEERSHGPPKRTREGSGETLGQTQRQLHLQEQLQQDEALAREMQEEERSSLRARRRQEQREDYRAAQVAQDEEIARYIQDQERKVRRRKPSEARGPLSQEGVPRQTSPEGSPRDAQQSQAGPSVPSGATAGVLSLERPEGPTHGGHESRCRQPLCRNIAEDLDPTFRAKGSVQGPTESFALSPQTVFTPVPGRLLPLDGFFDDLDGTLPPPPFVSPTKRQPGKLGHPKPRDKRESCKQQ